MKLIQCIHDKTMALKAMLSGDEYLEPSEEEEDKSTEETVSVRVKGKYM